MRMDGARCSIDGKQRPYNRRKSERNSYEPKPVCAPSSTVVASFVFFFSGIFSSRKAYATHIQNAHAIRRRRRRSIQECTYVLVFLRSKSIERDRFVWFATILCATNLATPCCACEELPYSVSQPKCRGQ